ncbi:HAMP domain-containing sensor histidine kinase [Clostridium sp.]|uniref:HAMP domain-containing sensor histidine kinase n=1 Tax=Clostridium sp. TaxID=1506 RepID=UPI003D6D5A10
MKFKLGYKFFIGFVIIFSVGFIIMNHCLRIRMESDNESVIEGNLGDLKDNFNIYVRQYFLINNISLNEDQFKNHSEELGRDLRNNINYKFQIYDLAANIIYSTNREDFLNKNNQGLINAKNNISSYTLKEIDPTIVSFTFPLIIQEKNLGIVSFIKDYSSLYDKTDKMLIYILTLTGCVFAVIFLFLSILTRSITIPIIKLSKASKEIAQGKFSNDINIKSSDEIGELSINFFNMVETLRRNMEIIENDRDKLKELSSHRKKFFDNVTNELKTPLTTIFGYAEMIKSNGFNDEDFFDKATDHIIDESKRLHHMVLKLLELSKEEIVESKYDYEPVNLYRLIKSTCEEMSLKGIRYNTLIHCETQNDCFTLGNNDRLKEVLINLIDNAIKYGRPDNVIQVKCYKDEKNIYIRVCDNGIGMSKEQLKNIVQPFYSADKKSFREIGSCGLGLSIVQAILKSHHGEIDVQSILNNGTTVIIKLPIYTKSLQD